MRWRQDRDKARRVAEYADALIVRQRSADERTERLLAGDNELDELRALARELTDMRVIPPKTVRDEVARRVTLGPRAGTEPAARQSSPARIIARCLRTGAPSIRSVRWSSPPSPSRTAIAALLIMGVVLAVPSPIAKPPIVSAAELLSRSDAALAQLVQPGEVLYRCWRVTLTSWDQPAAEPKTQQHVVHEWMDGADFERVAGRTSTTDGRLLMAYVSAREGENIRARVYFSPGFSDEPLGALNIEPTRAEFLTAVERFPANDRPLLQTYLDRYYIYMPIAGERRFNRAMLEGSRQPSLMPRVILSFDDAATLDGEPVYRIRVVDPARVRFRWRSEGPPVVQLARAETVRFIAKDSYLTLKAEQTNEFENGRRTFSIREMVENRAIRVADLARDPFQLDVPPGTPVQRQSAFELLTGVARVLKRIPAAATEP